MKKFFGCLLSLLIVSVGVVINAPNATAADGAHKFSVKLEYCVALNEDMECVGPNNDPSEPLPVLSEGDSVNAGDIIRVGLIYGLGTPKVEGVQADLLYNSTIGSVLYLEECEPEECELDDDGGLLDTDPRCEEVEEGYWEKNVCELQPQMDIIRKNNKNGGIWPTVSNKSSDNNTIDWTLGINDDTENNKVALLGYLNTSGRTLSASGEMAYFYYKVNDDATNGADLSFTYDDTTIVVPNYEVELSGANLKVVGSVSSNTGLSNFEVKNDDVSYPITETPDGDGVKRSVIVPSYVATVDLVVTPEDENTTIYGDGNKNIAIGSNNHFEVVAEAENGDNVIYPIDIKRLNNDATLTSLTVSGIDIGTFDSDTSTYSATVPYSKKTTTVSATVDTETAAEIGADPAVIDSGLGTWDLDSYGSTVNTRQVVVQAENCNYSSVDTCTSKTYTINITREAPSTNAKLSDLKVNGTTVTGFNPDTLEYTISDVQGNVSSLTIGATAQESTATIEGTGSIPLSLGNNQIVVTSTAEDGTTKKNYKINVKKLSDDASLSGLSVTSDPSGSLDYTFSSTRKSYKYTAPSSVKNVVISATANSSLASILSGPGTYDIDETNKVTILIQAEDGTQDTYEVNLERTKSTDATLKSLSIDGYSFNETFSSATEKYTLTVSSTVSSVEVSAEATDSRATITSGTGSKTLKGGINTINVVVTAEDGTTTKTYTIEVNKLKKTIASLTDLKVNGTTITGFSSTTLEYTLPMVTRDVDSINIEATKSDPDSSVTGDGAVSLALGDNELYVVVTAEDGITQTSYKINVEREKDHNAYLSDIKIDGVTITDFNKETLSYDITVANSVKALDLSLTKESEFSSYNITGNEKFVTTKENEVKIEVTAEDGTTKKEYKLNVTREKSDNNYLSSISLSTGTLNETFNKETTSYTVDVPKNVESITVDGVLEDASATKVVEGPTSLLVGDNTFTITVTSELSNDKVYTIVVTRNKSTNADLKDIKIDDVSLTGFSKNTIGYTINVDNSVTEMKIEGILDDSSASLEGNGTFVLNTGENNFPIVVTAEDTTTTKTYTITVNRAISSDATLKSITLNHGSLSPAFGESSNDTYTVSVPYSVSSIEIGAETTSSTASLRGEGTHSLSTGDNTIELEVTAEDGTTTKTYTIVVSRDKNNNAKLSDITLSGGHSLSPEFDPDTIEYTVDVDNSTSNITITTFTDDPAAKGVSGGGEVDLTTGENTINLVVTAEDGTTTKTYTLKITRALNGDTSLKSLSVTGGTLDPEFPNATDDKYTVSVPNEYEDVTINAVPNVSTSTVSISGNAGLEVGENEVSVVVLAENGDERIYTITVDRQKSTNNFLKSLSIKDSANNEYISSFNKTILEYDITVANEVSAVAITAEADASTSTVTGTTNYYELLVGENTKNIVVTSEDGYPRTYILKITRQSNSNSYLSSLEVEGKTLNETFNKTTLEYTLDVDSSTDKIVINATPEVETSSVSGTGEKELSTGSNEFNIVVTAEDNSTQTYKLTVNKAASDNNLLANLTVSEGELNPNFNKNIENYSVHVTNDISVFEITATPEHPAATVTGDGIKSIPVGTTDFEISVTAENSDKKTYTITVDRDASSNNYLSFIKLNGEEIDGFNKLTTEYSIDVDNSVITATIESESEDENAVVEGNDTFDLLTGSNEFNIIVTAENGDSKTYKLTINREKSNNDYLSSLSATEGSLSPDFDKNQLTYSITIPNEKDKLNLSYSTESSAATVEVTGNENFVVGSNTVEVKVTSEVGTTRTYTLNVTRQDVASNYLSDLKVTDMSDNELPLDTDFDKDTMTYTVEIPSGIDKVKILAQTESSSSEITGTGELSVTTLPTYKNIVVTSSDNISRTYRINFVKKLSINCNLANLSVSPGSLSPEFNGEKILTYTVEVPVGTTEVDITATKGEANQTITGTGKHPVSTGTNMLYVTVTSESGRINTYPIRVIVQSDDNILTSLSVDKGRLSPAFKTNIKSYSVLVPEDEDEITVSATGKHTIIGTGIHQLEIGCNVIEVVTIDDENNKNVYTVAVYRDRVVSNYLKYLQIDGYGLDQQFEQPKFDYSKGINDIISDVDVIAIPEDQNATVTISGNNNLVSGNNIIEITVTDETNASSRYVINLSLGLNKIMSDVHEIDDNYVLTITEGETALNVKDEMKNPNETIKIYDTAGDEISNDDPVGTGCTIKLIVNGVELDSKTLIVKGDINGDGEIGVSDIIKIRLHILETAMLNEYESISADTNNDEDIGVADLIMIRSHILGNSNLFAKESE